MIELMVAMLLGLIVIAGAGSVFLASSRTYTTNVALSDVQTSSRIGFEMMARDLRQAGLNGCDNSSRVANVLNNGPSAGGTTWWADWNNAVHGYDNATDPALTSGTAQSDQVPGTDSIQLIGAGVTGLSIASDSEFSGGGQPASIKLNETTSNLTSGDVVVICDPNHAVLAQISTQKSSTVTFTHNKGKKQSPGNCTKGLGYPTICATANGSPYTYGPNSMVTKLRASDWYIGVNPAGGRSLYRLALTNSGGNEITTAEEMVRNVTDMQITYHQKNDADFVDASAVAKWNSVDAVQITLQMQSTNQRAGTDAKPISRTFTSTTTLRNRVN